MRVSSNTAAIPDARTPRETSALLRAIVQLSGHAFWPDDVSAADGGDGVFARVVGYRQVSDAHLLSLAIRRGGRLATFDAGVRDLVPPGLDPGAVVELIP